MKLMGVEFGPVLDASGVQGRFGEGPPLYQYAKHIGLDFTGSTFIARSTALFERRDDDSSATAASRWVKPLRKYINLRTWMRGIDLRSDDLAGPGAHALLNAFQWQAIAKPFILSFASPAAGAQQRSHELRLFCELLRHYQPGFISRFGLQIEFPSNIGNCTALIGEVGASLKIVREILPAVPLMPKFNVLVSPTTVREMQGYCDAVFISGAVPWGEMPDEINWRAIFGERRGALVTSPLDKFGGGGLSGAPVMPILANWVRSAKRIGLRIPISVGGGILACGNIDTLVAAGLDLTVDAVFICPATVLRPWRVRKIICRAHQLYRCAIHPDDSFDN